MSRNIKADGPLEASAAAAEAEPGSKAAGRGRRGQSAGAAASASGGREQKPGKGPDTDEIFAAGAARAAQALVELLEHPGGEVRLRAANSILDRALGKAESGRRAEAEGPAVVLVRQGAKDE